MCVYVYKLCMYMYKHTHRLIIHYNAPAPPYQPKVMALVSHRPQAPAEAMWEEAMAVARALRAPEATKRLDGKEGEEEEEEDMGTKRSDALFGAWAAEALAVRACVGARSLLKVSYFFHFPPHSVCLSVCLSVYLLCLPCVY